MKSKDILQESLGALFGVLLILAFGFQVNTALRSLNSTRRVIISSTAYWLLAAGNVLFVVYGILLLLWRDPGESGITGSSVIVKGALVAGFTLPVAIAVLVRSKRAGKKLRHR